MIQNYLYLLIYMKADYINVCICYIYRFSTAPFFVHTIRFDWLNEA